MEIVALWVLAARGRRLGDADRRGILAGRCRVIDPFFGETGDRCRRVGLVGGRYFDGLAREDGALRRMGWGWLKMGLWRCRREFARWHLFPCEGPGLDAVVEAPLSWKAWDLGLCLAVPAVALLPGRLS